MSAASVELREDLASTARLAPHIVACNPACDVFVYDCRAATAPAEHKAHLLRQRGDPRPFFVGTRRNPDAWIYCKSLAGALSAARRIARQVAP